MANARIAYGLAKKEGINTDGMSPKEVWEALNKKGITPESTEKSMRDNEAQKRNELEKKYNDDLPNNTKTVNKKQQTQKPKIFNLLGHNILERSVGNKKVYEVYQNGQFIDKHDSLYGAEHTVEARHSHQKK